MPTSIETLEAEVMNLPAAERAHLLERLVNRLDVDPDVEQSWQDITDERDAELQAGTATPVPGAEAIARLQARLR